MRKHKVIYHMLDDITELLEDAIPPLIKVQPTLSQPKSTQANPTCNPTPRPPPPRPLRQQDEPTGTAQVKQLFTITKKGVGKVKIAGCVVTEGKLLIQPNHLFRVLREVEEEDGATSTKIIHQSRPGRATLQYYQDEVNEVNYGSDCGVGVGYDDLQEGDVVECFERVSVKQRLV